MDKMDYTDRACRQRGLQRVLGKQRVPERRRPQMKTATATSIIASYTSFITSAKTGFRYKRNQSYNSLPPTPHLLTETASDRFIKSSPNYIKRGGSQKSHNNYPFLPLQTLQTRSMLPKALKSSNSNS